MFNFEKLRAIGAMVARQAQEKAVQESTTANEVISMAPLLKEWKPGKHEVGEVVVQNGSPYKVIQTHDSTGNPTWNPADTPALFAPYHATDRAHALPWRAPTGAHDTYHTGEWMIYTDGLAYECRQGATVYGPDVLPEAWEAAE